jgi:hypothetical protein
MWQLNVQKDFVPVECTNDDASILNPQEIFNKLIMLFKQNGIL